MGTWFRDYVYIPLGGNKGGLAKQLRNIAIVWLLTGFWHGASWNFVLWGVYFGVLLVLEKLFLLRCLKRLPAVLRHIYALVLVTISWTLFAFTEISKGAAWCKAMLSGVLAGYPVVDVKVTLYDGSYHEVDSSEMAFKIAGSMAFKEACRKANAVLLEPIMKVSVIVPDEYLGTVIGDLTSRRGQIQGYEMRSGAQQIDAFVPLSEMFGYATNLRSRTQGRGQYTMEPSHYVELPKSLQEKLVSKRTGKDE